MRAARYHAYGGADQLVIDEIPIPEPGEGEIRVKVAGAGVIPFDWKVMSGAYREMVPQTLPQVFGHEVSGTVDKLGVGVTGFELGDAVYGQTRKGAAAEYTTMPITSVAKAPTTLDLADAAGVPVGGMTAWQALFDHGDLRAGQKVLIHGGAGGVGMFAIQLAKWKGATVVTTASASNEHFVRQLGADEVIDYTSQPFENAVRDVDIVLDTIGGETQLKSLNVLKPGGILVSIVGLVDAQQFNAAGRRTSAFAMQPVNSELDELRDLIEEMKVNVVVTVELPLNRIQEAVTESMSGHARGKIVVRI